MSGGSRDQQLVTTDDGNQGDENYEATRELVSDVGGRRLRRRAGPPADSAAPSINVTVVNEPSKGNNKAPKDHVRGRRGPMEQGNVFSHCHHCREVILWHPDPLKAVRPYQCCNNKCTGDLPKAFHISCIVSFCSLPENDNAKLTAKCDHCGGWFDLDQLRSFKLLFTSFFKSKKFWVTLALFIIFLVGGFAWKTWNFYTVVVGKEPVDLINNPALTRYNNDTKSVDVVRPLFIWRDWVAYNHCVITEWGRRRLLSDFEKHQRKLRHGSFLPHMDSLSMSEAYSKLYSFILDTSDESYVDLTHYFSPCSDTGTLGISWRWTLSHLAICLHAWRWYIVTVMVLLFIVMIDMAIGWRVWRMIIRNTVVAQVTQAGHSYVVRPVSVVAGQRRKLI